MRPPDPSPIDTARIAPARRLVAGTANALHPQTLLAYGMNGEALQADHGAPLRLRLGRHLGYKYTKYLSRIVVTDRKDLYRPSRGPGTAAFESFQRPDRPSRQASRTR